MGVDAEAVAKVEAQREKGRKVTPTRYILAATRATLAYARKQPRLTVELPGREPVSGVYFVFVSNSSPWTYADARPMCTNPDTSFESGLGVFGVTRLKVVPSLRLVAQMFSKQPKIAGDQVVRDDNADCVRVTCADPPMAEPNRRRLPGLARGDDVSVGSRRAERRRPAGKKAVLTCGDRSHVGNKHWSDPRQSVVQPIKGFGNRSSEVR